jgi:23S rRNA (adenine2503-C2)-methyltransferase
MKKFLLDIPFGDWVGALGLPPGEAYRARQVLEWVFSRRVRTFAEMTDLPAARREDWEGRFTLRTLVLERSETSALDGTIRLSFRASDGASVVCVLLPGSPRNSEDGSSVRLAVCLSTQVGCAWGCVFCASGRTPFQRNLGPGEMLEQVLEAEAVGGRRVANVLFMGMGEPLANLDNVLIALRTLRSPLAFHLGARHVTVSTAGLVPAMLKLSSEAPKVNLAVSLHAADDETRRRLLPKAARWPIKEVLKAAWTFQEGMGGDGRVTFEYILIKGINDSAREAQRLSNLIRSKNAWVNLIVINPVPGLPYEAPADEVVDEFAKILKDRGIFVHVRKPQGRDIGAGCGQLTAFVS